MSKELQYLKRRLDYALENKKCIDEYITSLKTAIEVFENKYN